MTERPTGLRDQCYDCAEWYHACQGVSVKTDGVCRDRHRLPDVGVGGKTGQVVPASRMGGWTEPRMKRVYQQEESQPQERATRNATPAPQATYDKDGIRRCACGQAIAKRRRCCNACREVRRKETVQRRRKQTQACPEMAQEGGSLALPAPRTVNSTR